MEIIVSQQLVELLFRTPTVYTEKKAQKISCYQVVVGTLFWTQKRNLDAK